MKKITDKQLVKYLWERVMIPSGLVIRDYSNIKWDPLNNMAHAWAMHGALRNAKVHEYPLFLCLSDDGGIYYRARVHHQYDFMLVSDCVDYRKPTRAICMAVYNAMQILDNNLPWQDHTKMHGMYLKPETPKVGLGVFLKRDGKILLGQRKNSHGKGTWALPGGHLELGESFTSACAREVKEETGIIIKGIKKLSFHNDTFKEEGLHYVTLFFEALWDESQEPKVLEPNKMVKWTWYGPNELPDNMLPSLVEFLAGCTL